MRRIRARYDAGEINRNDQRHVYNSSTLLSSRLLLATPSTTPLLLPLHLFLLFTHCVTTPLPSPPSSNLPMHYSRDQLLEIQPSTPNFELVNRLRELRLGVGFPRKRVCRGGRNKLRSIQVVPSRNLHPLMVPPFFQPHPDLQSAVGNAPLSSKHPTHLPTTDCLLFITPLMSGQPSDAPALSPPSPLQQGGQSSNAPALSPPSPLPQGGQPIALALLPSSPPPQDGQPSDAPELSPSSSTLLLCPSDSTLSICHLNSQSAVKTEFVLIFVLCHDGRVFEADNLETRREVSAWYLRHFNQTTFNNKLPVNLAIFWNKRLLTTAGRCLQATIGDKRVAFVQLSVKICDTPERVRDTLLHEMCHAATWVLDGVQHTDHGECFQYWAERAARKHPDLPPINSFHTYAIRKRFTYSCLRCKNKVDRHSKSIDPNRQVCGLCGGKFDLQENHTLQDSKPKNQRRPPGKKDHQESFTVFVQENEGKMRRRHKTLSDQAIAFKLGQQFDKRCRQ
ncbi:hypothetical protein ACOMHN_030452 [Nucella lapillus]